MTHEFYVSPTKKSILKANKLAKKYSLKLEPKGSRRFIDITGAKSDRLLVLGYAGNSHWHVRCSCGTIKTLASGKIRVCGTRSCGCLAKDLHEERSHGYVGTLVYGQYTRLLQNIRKGTTNPKTPLYFGKEACKRWTKGEGSLKGIECFVEDVGTGKEGYTLVVKPTKSKVLEAKHLKWVKTSEVRSLSISKHGLYKKGNKDAGTANTHRGMLERCHSKKSSTYPRYGGVGIKVCRRWRVGEEGKSGLACFLEDMGPRPTGMTLDRVDNSKGYRPSNCRWATPREQRINQRSRVVNVTYKGKTQTLQEWSEELGIRHSLLYSRYTRGKQAKEILAPE